MFRGVILAATTNPAVSRYVRRYGMRMGAARFVAGETLDEAVISLRKLNEQGLVTNTTLLGEGVRDQATAMAVVDEYEKILDRIAEEKLQTNIALKLTHLGLDVSEELAFRNLTRLVEHAHGLGNFIRIDMEESAQVDATLRIYRQMRAEGHENVGTVLQAYLYRTERDLDDLLPLKPNLRLVKGAYLEPQNVAYPQKSEVDRNYLRLAERMLSSDGYTAIATHDEQIIDYVVNYTHSLGIERDRFEFQMLYGIRPQLQLELVKQGYKVLVATPFGHEWYFYLMRRLAERPANAFFLLRNLILK
jgi:proline dehydrogenase